VATWYYEAALRQAWGHQEPIPTNKKVLKAELKLVEEVSKRTEKRLKEYEVFYGHNPQEEHIIPDGHRDYLPCIDLEILAEAVAYEETLRAEVDCDEWELEKRMRHINFRPNWFAKWLFENGMWHP